METKEFIDINEINDIVVLESLAYRQAKILEQCRSNIQMCEQRMNQLAKMEQDAAESVEANEKESQDKKTK